MINVFHQIDDVKRSGVGSFDSKVQKLKENMKTKEKQKKCRSSCCGRLVLLCQHAKIYGPKGFFLGLNLPP